MENLYSIFACLITIAVAIAYVNYRFIKLQTSIALMLGSLLISIVSIVISQLGAHQFQHHITLMVSHLHFHDLLINGMLSFLLFAGALNIELPSLRQHKWLISTLASVSTIASAFIIAGLMYYLLAAFKLPMPFIYCFLFGALISPTDPIAVLAMCKEINAPKTLKSILGGESLFNDGVGIVLFLLALHIIQAKTQITGQQVFFLFCQQSIGGIAYGLLIGLLGYWLMKPIQESKLRVLITIAIVTGGYGLAETLFISAPLAMVAAGITIGHLARKDNQKFEFLQEFWAILDEFLNALLFLIIGFEILVIHITLSDLSIAMLSILIILAARAITVLVPIRFFKQSTLPKNTTGILIWGGLRGALAIALSLSIPTNQYRDLIVTITYAVVIFSIAVQGLTVKPLVKASARD